MAKKTAKKAPTKKAAKKAGSKKTAKKSAKKAPSKAAGTAKRPATKAAKKTAKKSAKKAAKKARRTVMYSTGGKKLYAVRSSDGQFKDIQQYSRAHAQDIKRNASAEDAATSNSAAPSPAPF